MPIDSITILGGVNMVGLNRDGVDATVVASLDGAILLLRIPRFLPPLALFDVHVAGFAEAKMQKKMFVPCRIRPWTQSTMAQFSEFLVKIGKLK